VTHSGRELAAKFNAERLAALDSLREVFLPVVKDVNKAAVRLSTEDVARMIAEIEAESEVKAFFYDFPDAEMFGSSDYSKKAFSLFQYVRKSNTEKSHLLKNPGFIGKFVEAKIMAHRVLEWVLLDDFRAPAACT